MKLARDGIQLSFDIAGAGPPEFLFVHGLGGDRTHFTPQMKYFARQGRALTAELRGHGESDKPQQPYSIERKPHACSLQRRSRVQNDVGFAGFCLRISELNGPTVMLFGLPCEQGLPQIIAVSEYATHTSSNPNILSSEIRKTTGIVTLLQMDSSCADSPVRILHAQPGSPSPTR